MAENDHPTDRSVGPGTVDRDGVGWLHQDCGTYGLPARLLIATDYRPNPDGSRSTKREVFCSVCGNVKYIVSDTEYLQAKRMRDYGYHDNDDA